MTYIPFLVRKRIHINKKFTEEFGDLYTSWYEIISNTHEVLDYGSFTITNRMYMNINVWLRNNVQSRKTKVITTKIFLFYSRYFLSPSL